MDDILTATRVKLGSAFTRRGPLASSPLLPHVAALVAAADQFVVQRVRPGAMPGAPADRETIIAGYPWFADWGRDCMIALPGLLLTTGRFTEARKVLETFAGACKDGLIPNVFDDYTGQAHYNTVDAALWFIQACCRYFDATGDDEFFIQTLLPACKDIVAAYSSGTHYAIAADPLDGLISAGDPSTQLTWMDAKRDGVVFTPRHGKPVEINALWHSGLRQLAHYAQAFAPELARTCAGLAEKTARSFAQAFWNPHTGCLFDVITPHGPDASIRPNQLFAISLPHCPLPRDQQRSIVEVALRDLYTPHGVRTLAPSDPGYKPRFRGRMFDRDAAYHNGTAWPWLMGPLAEAICRADDFSPAALAKAQSVIGPLLGSLQDGCLGQLAEVYDAEHTDAAPQQPGGCPAQAWSVAEALRVVVIIARGQAGIAS
jgi:predicted glycogen debranching enzyme